MIDKFFLEDYIQRNNIPNYPRRVLTEYLQTEILAILYASKFSDYLSFLGGTCLRFVYKIDRFSEDLDFDLIKGGLNCESLSNYIGKRLRELGFIVEIKFKQTENIFLINIKFSQVMREMKISAMENQRLSIKFEIDPHPFKGIKFETKTISSYGKSFSIIANSLETLFAQKVLAIAFRPYQKGRDLYDLVWFLTQKNIEPNYAIFKNKKMGIDNKVQLVDFLNDQLAKSDLRQGVRDVERFLFYPQNAQWILKLPKLLEEFKK